MATTKADISKWFDEGKAQGATHMLIICDTFEYDDYPVYVNEGSALRLAVEEYGYDPNDSWATKNMQRVMECYDLRVDKQVQLDERRAFHFDESSAEAA